MLQCRQTFHQESDVGKSASHLQRSHKLNRADQRQRTSRFKVEFDRVQEVDVVHLDVHEDVKHLDTRSGVDGDCG